MLLHELTESDKKKRDVSGELTLRTQLVLIWRAEGRWFTLPAVNQE